MFMSMNKFRDDRRGSARERLPFQTPPLWLWLFLTLLGSSPSLLLFAQDLLDLRGMNLISGHVWGRDFVNVWTGGHLVLEGRVRHDLRAARLCRLPASLVGPLEPHYYSYPPSHPVSRGPLRPAALSVPPWPCGSLAAWRSSFGRRVLTSAKFRAFRSCSPPSRPPALINVWAGHYGFLIGALWLACFARIERRPGARGSVRRASNDQAASGPAVAAAAARSPQVADDRGCCSRLARNASGEQRCLRI